MEGEELLLLVGEKTIQEGGSNWMNWKRVISALLIMVLVICGQGNLAAAEEKPDEEQDKVEIIEQREADKKYYALPDGTFQCVVYSQRVHFINEIGVFEEIDNTLIRECFQTDATTYAWRNARNDVTTRFAENAEPGSYPIRIEKGTTSLEFGFDRETALLGKINPEEVPDLLGGVVDPEASISYADVFPGTDMLYYVGSSGVKEFIIIKNAEAEGIYRFNIHAEETTIEERDNRIVFIDAQGEEVLEITPFFATDSMDHYCGDITHSVEDLGDDNYRLEIVIDQEWLQAEERVFPVVLDPSVMVTGAYSTYDTFVSSAYPSTNYYEDYYLRTGKDSTYGVRKTLIKFDMPSGINSTQVTSAQIRVRKYDGDGTGLRAYRVTGYWTSSGATWNNRPTSSSIYSNVHLDSDNWYYTTVTNCTQGWLSESYTNYGIYIVDSNESSNSKNARWYSSDSAYPNRPELVVNYTAAPSYNDHVNLYRVSSSGIPTTIPTISSYFINAGFSYTAQLTDKTAATIRTALANANIIHIEGHGSGGGCIVCYNNTVLTATGPSGTSIHFPVSSLYGEGSLSSLKLAFLSGCKTALYNQENGDLDDYLYYTCGVKCTVAFLDNISFIDSETTSRGSPKFRRLFYYYLIQHEYSVSQSIAYALENTREGMNYFGLNSVVHYGTFSLS